MSNFSCPDKLNIKRLAVILLMFSSAAFAANEAPVKSSSKNYGVEKYIEHAKELFLQKLRKEALEEIEKARIFIKSKKDADTLDEKKRLFLDQYYSAESFQKYQEARIFNDTDRWNDCIRVVDLIANYDQTVKSVMLLKANCLKKSFQYDLLEKILFQLRQYDSTDIQLSLDMADVMILQKKIEGAGLILTQIKPVSSTDMEKHVLLRAKIFDLTSKTKEAIDLLREDQENYIDHVNVIYELSQMYLKKAANDWMARKYLALFVGRCKRMSAEELKLKELEDKCLKSQDAIVEIDKKLGV